MWIKKTEVKTKSGTYTYVQLIQSERIQGKSRHRVLANLGRLDNLDLEKVNALVDAIHSGTGDSLDIDQICLLPSKKYGASIVLHHMLVSMGIERFLSDLARYKKKNPDVSKGIFALFVYYSVSEDASLSFSSFLNQYALTFSEPVDQKLLESAVNLLSDPSIIRAGLLNRGKPDFPCFHYIYDLVNDNLKKLSESAVVLIVLDSSYTPVDFRSMKQNYKNYFLNSPADVFISDNFSLLKKCGSFHPETSRYICRLARHEVPMLFKNHRDVLDFAGSKGIFRTYRDLGFRTRIFENKTVIVLRPAPGIAERVTARDPEPREILIGNLSMTPEEILEHYLYLEKMQSYYFNIFLPRDLDFLYKKLSSRRVLYAVQNLLFIKILILDTIEKRVRTLGLTAADVLCECDSIRSAQLYDGHSIRRFHSKFTPLQMEIFGCLGLYKHPTLEISPHPQLPNPDGRTVPEESRTPENG